MFRQDVCDLKKFPAELFFPKMRDLKKVPFAAF
jgi:hypothetical protein